MLQFASYKTTVPISQQIGEELHTATMPLRLEEARRLYKPGMLDISVVGAPFDRPVDFGARFTHLRIA